MTGYHITIGYNSAGDRRKAFETLKAVVQDIRTDSERLIREVWREKQYPHQRDRETLKEYAEMYLLPARDHTLTIIEPHDDEPGQIMQLASGGGESRDIKEELRRAFSRLVILEMHRRGIEVNLVVA